MLVTIQISIVNEELERGIEQDIKVTVGSQEFIFRTVPTTKMGDDLFDD